MTAAVLIADQVHTLDGPDVEAIRIEEGRIVALGSRDEVRARPGDRLIELPGATISPGWTDSHIHPIAGLEMARGTDLSGCSTLDEVRATLRAALDGLADSAWLLGWGLDPNVFGHGPVQNRFLDEIAGARPAAVNMFDAHSMVASSAALGAAGITGARTFSDGSRIVTDAAGRPTGYLLELQATGLVSAVLPELTFGERVDGLRAVLQRMAETGFTAGQMLDLAAPDSFDLLRAIEATGDLPIRLRISPWCLPAGGQAQLERLLALQGEHGRRWWVDGVKLMIDGTIDNGTAWLKEPDLLGESTASLWLDPGEYRAVVQQLHRSGVPTTTHAIGDGGIDFVSRTLAALPRDDGRRVQHRIEHIETLPDDVLDVLVSAGIATSMQPTHCTHFVAADGSDNWSRRLGAERAGRGFRTRDVRDAGLLLALGSDWPVAPSDARAIAAEARTRVRFDRAQAQPVGEAQRLTAVQVLEGFTTHPWASVGREGGRLRVGDPADLTVFDADPLTAEPEDFARCRVLLTMIAGEPVVDPEGLLGRPGDAAGTREGERGGSVLSRP